MNPVDDSPLLTLEHPREIGAFLSMTAEMTLLFQALDAKSNVIGDWVPLYRVTWNCTGTAIGNGLNSTNWVLSGTNIWVSSYGDSGSNYPGTWTNNVENCKHFYPPVQFTTP
jgi:hypothetical protein